MRSQATGSNFDRNGDDYVRASNPEGAILAGDELDALSSTLSSAEVPMDGCAEHSFALMGPQR
jgi:hypothetical protein